MSRSFEPTARSGIVASARRNEVLSPLIAHTAGGLIGLDGLPRKVLTLETSTPSAVMSLVLATEFDTDVPSAALAVLTTTLVSVITVTGWLFRLM